MRVHSGSPRAPVPCPLPQVVSLTMPVSTTAGCHCVSTTEVRADIPTDITMVEMTKAEKSFRTRCEGGLLAAVGFMVFLLFPGKTILHLAHGQCGDGCEAGHEAM